MYKPRESSQNGSPAMKTLNRDKLNRLQLWRIGLCAPFTLALAVPTFKAQRAPQETNRPVANVVPLI